MYSGFWGLYELLPMLVMYVDIYPGASNGKTMEHEMATGNMEWLTGIILAFGTTRVTKGSLRVDH